MTTKQLWYFARRQWRTWEGSCNPEDPHNLGISGMLGIAGSFDGYWKDLQNGARGHKPNGYAYPETY